MCFFLYEYLNNAKNITDKAIRKTVFVAKTVAIPNPVYTVYVFNFLLQFPKMCVFDMCSKKCFYLRKALPFLHSMENQWNVLVTASKFDPVIIASSAGIICNCARLRYLKRSYLTNFDSTP